MRQYASIWNRLKTHKKATVATVFMNRRRIIKAVIKEKWLDTGYKLLLAEETKIATIQVEVKQSLKNSDLLEITFTLNITIKDNYIGINNL